MTKKTTTVAQAQGANNNEFNPAVIAEEAAKVQVTSTDDETSDEDDTDDDDVVIVEDDDVIEEKSYKDVIKDLIKDGCKRLSKLRIKNVNVTDKDTYVMVSLTLDKPILGYILDDDGSYYKGKTKTVFLSLYAIAATFKEDEELGWMANALLEHPEALNLILNGGFVDIVQQEVEYGDTYVNPFSSNPEPQTFDHDLIINHAVTFKLGKVGEKMADKLADKLFGF